MLMKKYLSGAGALFLSLMFCIGAYAAEPDKSVINVGDYIQLGTYKDNPIIWRYSGDDNNGKLMFASDIICYKSFDAAEPDNDNRRRKDGGSNLWSESNIRCWLNSDDEQVNYVCGNQPTAENVWNRIHSYDKEAGFLTNFTAGEKNAIRTVALKTPLNGLDISLQDGTYKTLYFDTDLNKIENEISYQNTMDRIFLLDCEQVDTVISNLGNSFLRTADSMIESEHMDGSTMSNKYFLRTPNADGEWSPDRVFSITVNNNEELPLDTHTMAYMSIGIRPAFYLNDNVEIASGRGTKKEPYILSTNNIMPTTMPEIMTMEGQAKLEVTGGEYIKVSVNGKAVEFDAKPFIDSNNRTLVPIRAVSEMLNAKVNWNGRTQTVTISQDGKIVQIVIGSDTMTVDGKAVKMDTKAIISEERTYIPIRFVAEALGLTVNWVE